MLRIDAVNIICIIINLLILFIAMKKFLFGPVQAIIEAREREAEELFLEVEAREAEAAKRKEEYENSLAKAENEKKALLTAARKEADVQYEKIVKEAKAKAKQMKKEAELEANARKEEILRSTKKEIADMIVTAAGKVAGGQRGEQANSSLYDEFLNKAGE